MARMHSELTEGWRILKVNALAGSGTYELVVSNFRLGLPVVVPRGFAAAPIARQRERDAAKGCCRGMLPREDLRPGLREFDVNDRRGATISRVRHIIAAVAIIVAQRYKRASRADVPARDQGNAYTCSRSGAHKCGVTASGRSLCYYVPRGHELWETFAR